MLLAREKNVKKKAKTLKKSLSFLLVSSVLCSCTVSNENSTISESTTEISLISQDESLPYHDTEISVISEESYDESEEESSTSSECEESEYASVESSEAQESSEISEEYSDYPYTEPSVTIESAGERFGDKFTSGEIIQTENSYQSQNVNVTLMEITYGGKLYFVQDIYIKNIESLSTGFAGLQAGAEYNDFVLDMVQDYRNAGYSIIGAINGDYCGINGIRNMKGGVIRNGKIYGTGEAKQTVCVLYKNGYMRTIPKNSFNAQTELERGAWQAWDFGPSFLSEDGSPLTTFTEKTDISGGGNPRTVIGYFEPGHYCFITAGGRVTEKRYGVSFQQMSAFANYLGCKVAYNLDGGESSVMVFGDKIINEEYQKTGRKNSDIVFIMDIK